MSTNISLSDEENDQIRVEQQNTKRIVDLLVKSPNPVAITNLSFDVYYVKPLIQCKSLCRHRVITLSTTLKFSYHIPQDGTKIQFRWRSTRFTIFSSPLTNELIQSHL